MTKAELAAKVADMEDNAEWDAGERARLKRELAEARDELEAAEATHTLETDRIEEAALKGMETSYTWLCLLTEHLDRMRAGLRLRAQAGKTLPGWERWEERARECLDGAQDALAV